VSYSLPEKLAGCLALDSEDCQILANDMLKAQRWAQHQGGALQPRSLRLLDLLIRHARSGPVLGHHGSTSQVASQVVVSASEVPGLGQEVAYGTSEGGDLEWLSTGEAAELVGVTPRAVRDAAKARKITAQRRGSGRGVLVVEAGSVRAWGERRRA
jgi:hypothetical protein